MNLWIVGDAQKLPAIVAPPEKIAPARIPRFETPPVIDGKLDDEAWKLAGVFKDFYQYRPSDTAPASRQTEVRVGYDAKFLYIGFHAYDEPSNVRATIAKRDAVLDDDAVGVFLDTFNDGRRAYVMFFNPFGVQQDGLSAEGRGEDFSFDLVMESKGVLTPDGYTVEVAIPFKSLRYEAGKGKLWGVHFLRQIKHINGELDSWMPISKDKSGFLNQEGHLTGLEGISTERTLELIPSLTLSETGKRVSSPFARVPPADPLVNNHGRFVNKPIGFEPGLTGKLGITPTVTLDFAIKPDFAQVESDQLVITANQRFPIFFEEKRPFFLEGKEIFETRIQAVHTRAIISPDYAVKLTGKRGRNTFGALLASDNAPGNFSEEERNDPNNLSNIQKFLHKNAYIGILRLKRDIGKENSIGLLATSCNFIEKHNQLGGFDGRFRLDKQTVINFQVLGTTSRRFFFDPDAGKNIYRTGNGLAYTFGYEKHGRHFETNFDLTGRTRDYRADVGFTRRTNTNREELFTQYRSEPKPKAFLISWKVFNYLTSNFDFQGRMQNWNNNTQVQFNLKRESFVGVGTQSGYERIFEYEFGQRRTLTRAGAFAGNDSERSTPQRTIYAFAGSTPSKKYSFFGVGVYNWNAFDFDFGAGQKFPRVSPAALLDPGNPNVPLDPGAGNELHLEGNFTYQPTNALNNRLSYTKDRLVRRDTGRTAFDDNIISLRSTYQFSRFTFARARADYDTLSSRIRAQFLLGWTPNPGTAFYVGYNDDLQRNGFSPFTGQLEPGFRRNGRTFFIKMSYLFRRSF